MNSMFKTISATITKDDESSQPLLGKIHEVNPPQLCTCQAPKFQEIPTMLGVPKMPQAPKLQEIPTMLGIPKMPQAPKLQEIPTMLGIQKMPQAPKIPEVSQSVKLPQMIVEPQVPQVLATATTPLIDVCNIPKSSAILIFKSIISSYLTSGTQKQAIISLVVLDLTRSLVSIILNFIQTEIQGTFLEHLSILVDAIRSILASVGFIISNAFVFELVASWWVFGWSYFSNPYHILDTFVVVMTFISGLLPSVVGDFMSLTVILRAWRLFKSVGTILLDVSPVQILPHSQV